VERPGGDDARPSASHFGGRGVTLGGDDAPSEVIDAPPAPPAPALRVRRMLHLWQDGFSVDDGPLFRYDDPQNQQTLDMIDRGRAPIHLLNVEQGQEVDLELDVKRDVKYVAPKKTYKPFSGSGQRLGSPTPAAPSSTTAASGPSSATVSIPQAASTVPSTPQITLDPSQPTLRLQIRLGNGGRLETRFNTTHTIGDVYDFVDQSQGETPARPYTLATTFPNKDHEDRSVALGDEAALRKGGVVVQKWK
jgi:UBX domain-containing protein 1